MTLFRSLVALGAALSSWLACAHGDEAQGASAPAGAHSHAASIGAPGKADKVSRTINVDMTDAMRFVPASVDVRQGQTIRFLVKNSGRLKHEFTLGTEHELKEHDELMKKFPEMEHADPNQVTVAPGKTGEVIWQFTQSGAVHFACLQPGHYDAGMKGVVRVAAAAFAQSNAGIASSSTAQATVATTPMSDGEVRKVDKDTKKITLKHGEIKNLEMPGMTMVFQVKDPAMLDAVKPGDKVKFKAERTGGALVITEIQPAK